MSKKLVPTDDELLAQFDDLGVSTDAVGTSSPTQPQGVADHDVVTELENLAFQRPASRPSTPQLKRSLTNTPPTDRTSEDKTSSRRSGDSTRPYHTSMTPTDGTTSKAETPAKSPDPQPANTGGGWWGGIFATASAAMKQAEAAVKEIQKNEEAQKWAEHVRGNVGVLKGLGMLGTLLNPVLSFLPCFLRRRTEDACNADIYLLYPYFGTSNLISRTPSNTHNTRPPWIPVSRSPHLQCLLKSNGTG